MSKFISLFITIIIFVQLSFSQNYFQQEVNFNIKVKLDDQEHTLTAFETIEYINNSPDTLKFIYFHLWPNAYKNNKTALAKQIVNSFTPDFYFDYKKTGGYIDSLDFKIDNKKVQVLEYKKYIDVCKLVLNKPIFPGDTIIITTPFFVKLPGDVSRLGHKEQSYQITQWFPKPAVYDRQGWHPMPYLNMGEFYSEFGSFDVSITVPKQYVVAATGNLQTETEKQWLDILVSQKKQGINVEYPESAEYKTVRYTEKQIHDFAWFANKDYFVNKSEVTLPNSKRKVTTWTMFTGAKSGLWKNAINYVNDALYYYSLWVMDYPYDNCTAVQGALSAGGGMEYPTITVISAGEDAKALENVIMHEVGHNWFYGILGFDERKHAFLDEGINSFYDARYMQIKFPNQNIIGTNLKINNSKKIFNLSNVPSNFLNELVYDLTAYQSLDQAINVHSEDYSDLSYYSIVYKKAPDSFLHLQEYLGIEKFDSIMQTFTQKWKFKHPQPDDLENHFKNNCDKDLDWFFDDVINTRKKSDYKINYRNKKLIVKNKGKIASPFCITGMNDTNEVFTKWYDGSFRKQKITLPKGDYNKIILDPKFATQDFDRYNNYVHKRVFLNKLKPIGFRIIPSVAEFDRTTLNFLPVIGWNSGNKWLFGILLHNYHVPQRKLQYHIMPMYSYASNKLVGSAAISYKKFGYNGFPDITYKLNYKTYSPDITNSISNRWNRIKAEIDLKLNNFNNTGKYDKHLKFAYYYLDFQSDTYENYSIINYKYILQKKSRFRPFNFIVNADIGSFETKSFYSFFLEANYRLHYFKLNSGLDMRFFAGSNVYLSGTTGDNDYKFDYLFPGRGKNYENSNNILSRQFINNYGGFALYTPSEPIHFLISVNIKSSIPKIPILKVYSNFALYTGGYSYYNYKFEPDKFAYEFGIMLSIIPNRIEVYLPLYASQEIWDYNNDISSKFYQKIRFVFNLNDIKSSLNQVL